MYKPVGHNDHTACSISIHNMTCIYGLTANYYNVIHDPFSDHNAIPSNQREVHNATCYEQFKR